MSEDFLHYIWKYKLYNKNSYTLPSGETLEIINPGEHNTNAGPDFINTRIKIGATYWAGCCEIHQQSAQWKQHNHHTNQAYNNVILHVVKKHNAEAFRANGLPIPTIEISYNAELEKNYLALEKSREAIACAPWISSVDNFYVTQFITTLAVERLEKRAAQIIDELNFNKSNWEETIYYNLAKAFGFKVNAIAFELLAKSVPLTIIAKHANNQLQIDALFLGQSGLLPIEQSNNPYIQNLQTEYRFLQNKYGLTPLAKHLWKFLRIRPANFPTVRIAQFAAIMCKYQALFAQVVEANNITEIYEIFKVQPMPYWQSHYNFNSQSEFSSKTLSKTSLNLLAINALIPVLFVYGKLKNNEHYNQKALTWLENIEAEKNSIIKQWEQIGVKPLNAFDSQALLQLRNEYCNFKRCIKCNIGNKIINRK